MVNHVLCSQGSVRQLPDTLQIPQHSTEGFILNIDTSRIWYMQMSGVMVVCYNIEEFIMDNLCYYVNGLRQCAMS